LTWSNFTKPVSCTTPAPAQDSQASRIFAEFETNLRRERQLEGIANGMGPSEIAKSLGIGRAPVYRALAD
jgi:DNA invertase Pin-like site-specific DNA recombinase